MPRHGNLAAAATLTLLVLLVAPASCAAAAARRDPVVVPVTKDPATKLYTIPVRFYDNLVVDLAGPLVWSTCADDHLPASLSCQDPTCRLANAYRAPTCKGVAIFGGGPIYLGEGLPDFTSTLEYTPLVTKKDDPAYYITANAIALDDARVPVPRGALAAGGVALHTSIPYGLLRPDVFRPFVQAFEKGLNRSDAKVAAVAPFALCYRSAMLWNTRTGYFVPAVRLMLAGGNNYTMTGTNSMVDVNSKTACLAFVEMKGVKPGDAAGSPAVILGGFQMENIVLQFDVEKQRLGLARLPYYTSCSNFNFTKTH
uniref:Peptidase A1 domain-containing protein n=1 Tax=Oryza brachyantha TaxID=4533 RepID=J3L7N3_ORYBR